MNLKFHVAWIQTPDYQELLTATTTGLFKDGHGRFFQQMGQFKIVNVG